MSQSALSANDAAFNSLPPWRVYAEIALVFAVFFLHGAWTTPDVNETGYLTKAQHFWNHDAFAHDFFCNTGDAHAVFYWAFGWLTTLGWSLDVVAWIGRIATWFMLAIAWRGLSYALLSRPWLAVLSAEIFILLTEQAYMAGEWIVGGVEAKGFAWAFVLWALHALVRDRWAWAWLLVGVATSLHVVVGGWAAVCLGIVWIASPHTRPAVTALLPRMVGGLILALPGLWFAARLNDGADWYTVAEASRIQVIERLPHHLFAPAFEAGYIPRHLLLWALFVLLCTAMPASPAERRLRVFVFATMGIAIVGLCLGGLVSLGPMTVQSGNIVVQAAVFLLRFYWLRLSDILVPIGVSILGLRYLVVLFATRRMCAQWICVGLAALLLYDGYKQVRHIPPILDAEHFVTTRADRDDSLTDAEDWRGVCRWANEHTPPGTVFLTPTNCSTFKWYSGRDEVATWKDIPQDARSIVKWWKRLQDISEVDSVSLQGEPSPPEQRIERLRKLGVRFGVEFVVVQKLSRKSERDPGAAYSNEAYAVYRVDPP
ncbi:MAG TPA: DUF6798 domain-containing protein [Pirellulales bacterium]|jgi:hypothetical protein